MLYLLLAVLSSTMISVVMRISTDKVSGNLTMLATNYLICIILGAVYTGIPSEMPEGSKVLLTLGLGALNGALLLGGFVLLQSNTRKNGIVLSSIFMKLGLLVPILVSILFFKEVPTALQIAGFCVAVGAIVLINLKKDEKGGFGLGLLLLLLVGGSADAMVKVFEVFGPGELSDGFLLISFGVAFVLCGGLLLRKKEHPNAQAVLFGSLIGIPNFFCSRFLLAALTKLPAVVVYPTFSVGTMFVVTLCGLLFFKERLEKRQWIAFAAVIAALVMLNV